MKLYENHLVSTETITVVKQQIGTRGCCLKSPRTERWAASSPTLLNQAQKLPSQKQMCHPRVKGPACLMLR